MFKKNIFTDISRIFKYKSYSYVNILGLSVGMASFILIILYVYDEYSYDKYHKKYDRIYRIVSVLDFDGVGEKSASQPFPLAPAMAKEFNKYVESYVRFFNLQRSQFLVSYKNRVYNEKRFFYCDSSVFDVFDFELIKGNKHEVLNEPFSIIITESTARKYFKNENPIGKKLTFDRNYQFIVKGVLKDIKQQSHFKFDFLASFSSLRLLFPQMQTAMQNWIWNPCWTYIVLKKGVDVNNFQSNLYGFQKERFGKEADSFQLRLQALSDIHLHSNLDYEIEKNGKIRYVKILIVIAFLILFIAVINFVNLITAGATDRAKYIGIRKAVGASRMQLMRQFLSESVLVSFISLFIAISFVELALPFFSSITGKTIALSFRFDSKTIISLLLLGFVIGLLSGIYPAIFLSNTETTRLLKNNFRLGTKFLNLRKTLVFLQVLISLSLIITTLGIFQQLQYLRTADLGFKKNNTIIINAGIEEANRYAEFKDRLLKYSKIQSVTAMNYIIGQGHNTYNLIPENSKDIDFQFYPGLFVRADFVETFEIKIVAGRNFTKAEEQSGTAILVNEEMIKHFNYEKPEDILNVNFINEGRKLTVAGVFSNINTSSLHTKVEPFVILIHGDKYAKTADTKYIVIKTENSKLAEAIKSIGEVWNDMQIQKPFEYQVLNDVLKKHYSSEEVLVRMVGIFTLLSIIISTFGIWGLSSYITERRTREIGIRKSLGASMFEILKLIIKEFAFIVVFANILSWIIAYIVLSRWINSFAYKDYINLWLFALASILASGITLLTVIQKAIKVGGTNPVESINYE